LPSFYLGVSDTAQVVVEPFQGLLALLRTLRSSAGLTSTPLVPTCFYQERY